MALEESFSKRNRYSSSAKEITVREGAPENLRFFILETANELGCAPSTLRALLCRLLRVSPDEGNWSEYPNIWMEVKGLLHRCDWFKVYDFLEAVYDQLYKRSGLEQAFKFEEELNQFFIEEGIGWQLLNGQIITRGTETFEAVVREATSALETSKRPTAAQHMHEALEDLSRRPKADLPGAVYHAMGALECIARDLSGDSKATLGEVLKRYPRLLPKPLDSALSQIWGYASNEARHIQEGRETNREEAELLVGLSAALSAYLTRKQSSL